MLTRDLVRVLAVAVFGIALVFGAGARAQVADMKTLKDEFNNPEARKNLSELIKGEREPKKEDQKLLDATARWYIYRVGYKGWEAWNKEHPADMATYHKDLEALVILVLGSSKDNKNRAFIDQLGPPFQKAFRDVFALELASNQPAVINAALMLPVVSRLKQEAVGDLLVELLVDKDNKYHDAIKVYAAKAMGEFLPAHMWKFTDEPKDTKRKDKFNRDTARFNALVKYIKSKSVDTLDEGERDVIRYLRREAIISLARTGVPALKSLKKEGKVEGPAAFELLQILVKGEGEITPAPSLSERVEAAIGLCYLQYPYGDNIDYIDYDPSVAIYGIGLCFLDFANEYSRDFVNLNNRNKKGEKANTKEPVMAWRIQAERFKAGMEYFDKSTEKSKAHARAKALRAEINPVADLIKDTKQLSDMVPITNKIAALAPADGKLYTLKDRKVTEEHDRLEINPAKLRGGAGAEGK